MGLLINRVTTQDIDIILEIAEEVGLTYWQKEDYQKEVLRTDNIFLVATDLYENRVFIQGFILARLITSSHCELYQIAVKKQFQGSKIGSLLLATLINRCFSTLKVPEIFLEVQENNFVAQLFYEKYNFTKISLRKNYFLNPVGNALIYSLKLDFEKKSR